MYGNIINTTGQDMVGFGRWPNASDRCCRSSICSTKRTTCLSTVPDWSISTRHSFNGRSTSIITIDLTFYFPFFLLLLASFRHIDVWQVTVLVRFEVATVKFVLVSCYFQLLYSILVVHSIVIHVDLYQFKTIASFQFNMCLLTLIH